MRASWAAFPMLALGEFLSSPSARDRRVIHRAASKCLQLFSSLLPVRAGLVFPLLASFDPPHLAPLNKSSHLSAAVLG